MLGTMEQTTFWTDFKRFAGRSYLGTFVAGLALGMLASGSPLALLAMVIVGSAWHAHTRARRPAATRPKMTRGGSTDGG